MGYDMYDQVMRDTTQNFTPYIIIIYAIYPLYVILNIVEK